MMKKMLVLALVLAVAGLANAAAVDLKGAIPGIDYTVVGKTVTITSTVPVIGFTLALQADNGSALSGVVVPPAFAAVNTSGGMSGGQWDGIGASVGGANPISGTILSFDFSTANKVYFVYSDSADFGAYNRAELNLSTGTVGLSTEDSGIAGALYYVVPEPMTMGLLALGALFLRKK